MVDLCEIDDAENEIGGYSLTSDGKFVRNKAPPPIAEQIEKLKKWLRIVQKVTDFLISETDLIIACCWNEGRRPVVNRVDIAVMFHLVAVEGIEMVLLKAGEG